MFRDAGFLAFSIFAVLIDAMTFVYLWLRSASVLAAENLFLRKQLAMYAERKQKPHRATDSDRFMLAQLMRFFDWPSALTVVKPDTLVRWHRKGFRLFWKWKSRRGGRPSIPMDLRKLIDDMATNNPTLGRGTDLRLASIETWDSDFAAYGSSLYAAATQRRKKLDA